MGVEHDRRKRGVGSLPFEYNHGLAVDEFDGLWLKGEGPRLREDEIGGLAIVRVRLGGVDTEVGLESRYD